MEWFISHKSALEFWRKAFARDFLAEERLPACKLPAKPMDARGLRYENPWRLASPLHVLVGSGNARKKNGSLVCHVDSRSFPADSFIRLDEEFCVDSPELCFAHMAGELPLIELVVVGYELCGGYRLEADDAPHGGNRPHAEVDSHGGSRLHVGDASHRGSRPHAEGGPHGGSRPHAEGGPHGGSRPHAEGGPYGGKDGRWGRGFRDDLPLTSVAQLKSAIAELGGMKGHEKACRALRHICDGAASPMETVLTMLLTLPYKLGGYGFPKPQLNAPLEVQVAVGAKGGSKKAKYYADLYWPDGRVDVEYDSDAYHVGTDQAHKDTVRRNALLSVGVSVLAVSRRQVVSTAELRKTAEDLSRLLEKPLQCPMPEFADRHAELRAQLLPRRSSRYTGVYGPRI